MKNKIDICDYDVNVINRLSSGNSLQKRGCDIFQVLLLSCKFKDFIIEIRKDLKIPKEGYNAKDDKEWHIVHKRFIVSYKRLSHNVYVWPELKIEEKVSKKIYQFIRKEGILDFVPVNENIYLEMMAYWIIRSYVLVNDVGFLNVGIGTISKKEHSEQDNTHFDQVNINFSPTATKEEMTDYIKRNWGLIKSLQESILGKEKTKRRLKRSNNFIRDVEIYNKYIELLEKKRKGDSDLKYIDIEIAKKFKDLNEGTIRSIISRINKLVSSINKNNVANKEGVLF